MIAYDVHALSYCYPGQPQPANKGISLQIQNVLAGFALVTFWLVGRKMDWHQL